MIEQIINLLRSDEERWEKYKDAFAVREIASRTVLLHEGEVSGHIHIIKKGCLRQWFNKDGKEITFQFFFEGQPVASIESFMNSTPSLFTVESIEPSVIISLSRESFNKILHEYPEIRNGFQDFIFQRFRNYALLFLSRIKDTPKERYDDLLRNHPEIIKRVPQHYIATYLGITPVSLSRIRSKSKG